MNEAVTAAVAAFVLWMVLATAFLRWRTARRDESTRARSEADSYPEMPPPPWEGAA